MLYEITEVWKQPGKPSFSITSTLRVCIECQRLRGADLLLSTRNYDSVSEEVFPIPLNAVGSLLVKMPTAKEKGSISLWDTNTKLMRLGNCYGHTRSASVDVSLRYEDDLRAIVSAFERAGVKISRL